MITLSPAQRHNSFNECTFGQSSGNWSKVQEKEPIIGVNRLRLIGAADDQQNSWTGTEQFQRIKLGLEIRSATKFTKPRETFDSWGVSAPQEWEPIFNLAKCHLNFANVLETFVGGQEWPQKLGLNSFKEQTSRLPKLVNVKAKHSSRARVVETRVGSGVQNLPTLGPKVANTGSKSCQHWDQVEFHTLAFLPPLASASAHLRPVTVTQAARARYSLISK